VGRRLLACVESLYQEGRRDQRATHQSGVHRHLELSWRRSRAVPQFLNVMESVFSGMARAVIHNSDYSSVNECLSAIDRYFRERNAAFAKNPRRAGNVIWGKERAPPVFSEANNCKDPRYR